MIEDFCYIQDTNAIKVADYGMGLPGNLNVWLAFAERLQEDVARAVILEVEAETVFVLDMRHFKGFMYATPECHVDCLGTAKLIDPEAEGNRTEATFHIPDDFLTYGMEGLFPCQFYEFPRYDSEEAGA